MLYTTASLVRFIVGGALNTAATFSLFWLLLSVLSPAWAYTCAYAAGILIAYLLNSGFVFRSGIGWRSAVLFPAVYILQYSFGLAVVRTATEAFDFPPGYAAVLAIFLNIPIGYLISAAIFRSRT